MSAGVGHLQCPLTRVAPSGRLKVCGVEFAPQTFLRSSRLIKKGARLHQAPFSMSAGGLEPSTEWLPSILLMA